MCTTRSVKSVALNRVLKIVLIFIHALNFSSNLGKSSQQVIACKLTFSLAKLLRVFQSGKGKIILWSTSCYENCRYMSASASLIYRIRLRFIKWIITQWFSVSKLFFVSICFQHFERKAKEDVDFFFSVDNTGTAQKNWTTFPWALWWKCQNHHCLLPHMYPHNKKNLRNLMTYLCQ